MAYLEAEQWGLRGRHVTSCEKEDEQRTSYRSRHSLPLGYHLYTTLAEGFEHIRGTEELSYASISPLGEYTRLSITE